MQVGTYPTRNFATLGPSELQPPFTEAYKKCQNIFFSPYSTGQVSVPIHLFTNLQRLVFLLNSRYPRFNANKLILLFLLPKLRNHFAKFLHNYSFKSFSLLNLSTCVGLSTVYFIIKKTFS